MIGCEVFSDEILDELRLSSKDQDKKMYFDGFVVSDVTAFIYSCSLNQILTIEPLWMKHCQGTCMWFELLASK